MSRLLLLFILAGLACRSTRHSTSAATSTTTRHYAGILPCADCAGIATLFYLEADGNYRLQQHYLGKPSEAVTTQGSYTTTGNRLRLAPKPAPSTPTPATYLVTDAGLQQLDLADEPITGALADRYVLQTGDLSLSEGERLLWVDAAAVPCTGVGRQTCLRIMRDVGRGKGLLPTDQDWRLLYNGIKGFDFQPGVVSLLVVREQHRAAQDTPADASSINYELVRRVGAWGDSTMALHDIWALHQLAGKAPYQPQEGRQHATLEINLTNASVNGNDGCNTLRGTITSVGAEELVMSRLLSTRMTCPEVMATADAFMQALNNTRRYRREGLKLHLLDERGEELMVLRKVD